MSLIHLLTLYQDISYERTIGEVGQMFESEREGNGIANLSIIKFRKLCHQFSQTYEKNLTI